MPARLVCRGVRPTRLQKQAGRLHHKSLVADGHLGHQLAFLAILADIEISRCLAIEIARLPDKLGEPLAFVYVSSTPLGAGR